MDVNENLHIIVHGHGSVPPNGIKLVKCNTTNFIWIWGENKIIIYETPSLVGSKLLIDDCCFQSEHPKRSEINLNSNVVGVFHLEEEDAVYVLDISGNVYSIQELTTHDTNSPGRPMEVEDIFCSPTTSDTSSKWREKIIMVIADCDYLISACLLTSGIAVSAIKDKRLVVLVYSFPELNFLFLFDLQQFKSEGGVLSCCNVSSMSPLLKQHFKDELEIIDTEIIIVGLNSGLVIWFCASTPRSGPFILFSAYNQVIQQIHWTKDARSNLHTHLIILLSSGAVIVFGHNQNSTLYLPDSVKTSWCLKHYIISSNLVDCYSSELLLNNVISLNSASLPVKGVCVVCGVPDSDSLILAGTISGTVYCLNPTLIPSGNPSQFAIPDQSLLDNMFLQTQHLESIYKHMNQEDKILKAISSAMVVNSDPLTFQLTLKVTSDSEFSATIKLTKSGIIFSHELWLICVEVVHKCSKRETSFYKLKEDFSYNNELSFTANHSLLIGTIITFELVSFLQNQHPLLIIPIKKVEIDACYLMATQSLISHIPLNQESLEDILWILNNQLPKPKVHDCKLILRFPNKLTTTSVLPKVLHDSQHRISSDEWTKISGGKKFNVHTTIHSVPVQFNLDVASRELIISCPDIQLCHQIKEGVIKRLLVSENKSISENNILDVQALYQTFEIESLKDNPDFQSFETIRKKLRTTISPHLCSSE